MRDFHAVIDELKKYIFQKKKKDKKTKVLDKDIAKALGLSQSNFATIKRRNSMPYENILRFCRDEKLCCTKVFFKD